MNMHFRREQDAQAGGRPERSKLAEKEVRVLNALRDALPQPREYTPEMGHEYEFDRSLRQYIDGYLRDAEQGKPHFAKSDEATFKRYFSNAFSGTYRAMKENSKYVASAPHLGEERRKNLAYIKKQFESLLGVARQFGLEFEAF